MYQSLDRRASLIDRYPSLIHFNSVGIVTLMLPDMFMEYRRVSVTKEKTTYGFQWSLSKQPMTEELKEDGGCWMTDGVSEIRMCRGCLVL